MKKDISWHFLSDDNSCFDFPPFPTLPVSTESVIAALLTLGPANVFTVFE